MIDRETEIIYRVWFNDDEGVAIEIGEYAEAPGYVELRTADEKSKKYFGNIRLSFGTEDAARIGRALIEVAKAMEAREK